MGEKTSEGKNRFLERIDGHTKRVVMHPFYNAYGGGVNHLQQQQHQHQQQQQHQQQYDDNSWVSPSLSAPPDHCNTPMKDIEGRFFALISNVCYKSKNIFDYFKPNKFSVNKKNTIKINTHIIYVYNLRV